jgi:hypothetical protein
MFTISLISQRREVTPAAIAGVIRGTLFKEAHYRAALEDIAGALVEGGVQLSGSSGLVAARTIVRP